MKTGKKYIGESTNIEKRWKVHKQDLANNNHGNFYLQKDFNSLGEKYFKFEVIQEIEPESITITQAKLIMLENAYIQKSLNNSEEIYNIENTLYGVLSGRKKLQIDEEIADKVVISNFLRYKYIFDPIDKIFVLRKRDTLENLILDKSTIKSKKTAQKIADNIFHALKVQDIYSQCTYEIIFDLYMYHKLQKRKIIELTDFGRKYILEHFDFDSRLLRKCNSNLDTNIKKRKTEVDFDEKDKNTIQDFWHDLKEKKLLPIENKYNEFRELLIRMNLIIIDKNRNTCATDFALKNKFFLVRAYNSSKDKYQYYISALGKDFIINNL